MIVTTGNDVAGYTIQAYIGIVRGIVVRSPSISQGFMGGLKQIVGGNIESYANVCEAAREEAYERMVQHAQRGGCRDRHALRCHRVLGAGDGSACLRHRRKACPLTK